MNGHRLIFRDHGIGVLDSELAARGHEQSEHRISQSVLHCTAVIVFDEFVRTALVHGAHPPGMVLDFPGRLLELRRSQDAQLLHKGPEPGMFTVDLLELLVRVRDSVKATDQMNELPRRGGTVLAQVVERRVPTYCQGVPLPSPLHHVGRDETHGGTNYHQQYARCCRGSIHADIQPGDPRTSTRRTESDHS
ncbi:hypothetical protein ACWDG1_30265 [Streptomyces sp. NPDC001177]